MIDILTTEDYSGYGAPKYSRFNPLGILINKERHFSGRAGGIYEKCKDIFFALRGQKQFPGAEGRMPWFYEVISFIESKKGDKFGLLDYGMLMIPVLIKSVVELLYMTAYRIMTRAPLPAKILFAIFLLGPVLALAFLLDALTLILDFVKNVLALAITCVLFLPLILPLSIHSAYIRYKTPSNFTSDPEKFRRNIFPRQLVDNYKRYPEDVKRYIEKIWSDSDTEALLDLIPPEDIAEILPDLAVLVFKKIASDPRIYLLQYQLEGFFAKTPKFDLLGTLRQTLTALIKIGSHDNAEKLFEIVLSDEKIFRHISQDPEVPAFATIRLVANSSLLPKLSAEKIIKGIISDPKKFILVIHTPHTLRLLLARFPTLDQKPIEEFLLNPKVFENGVWTQALYGELKTLFPARPEVQFATVEEARIAIMKNMADIRKAARVFSQAERDSTNACPLPSEALLRIARFSGSPVFNNKKYVKKIVNENWCRPPKN